MSIDRVRRAMTLSLWAIAMPAARGATAAGLGFYAAEYPPITFSRGGKVTGLATEIVEEIMRRIGMVAPIELVPWARAFRHASSAPNIGLFSTAYTRERAPLFQWVGPIGAAVGSFYMMRGGQRIENIGQARKAVRILVSHESYLEQMLRGLGFGNLSPVTTTAEAVRMLAARRAPLMALDDLALATTAKAEGLNAGAIERALVLGPSFQYIAFSRGTPEEVVARWRQVLDAMKADGTFARLYAKWLPGVKPPQAPNRPQPLVTAPR